MLATSEVVVDVLGFKYFSVICDGQLSYFPQILGKVFSGLPDLSVFTLSSVYDD